MIEIAVPGNVQASKPGEKLNQPDQAISIGFQNTGLGRHRRVPALLTSFKSKMIKFVNIEGEN